MTIFHPTSKARAPYATFLLGLALSCLPAAAQATYTYTGPNFTFVASGMTSSGHISATMQLTSPLPPNQVCIDPTTLPGFSLTMTDGENGTATWPALGSVVRVSTDASGAIAQPWDLVISYAQPLSFSRTLYSLHGAVECGGYSPNHVDVSLAPRGPYGIADGGAGVWTNPVPTVLLSMLTTQFQAGVLPDIGTSFAGQLQLISNDLATGNGLACLDLQSFANHVKAQTGKKISESQSDFILHAVAMIASALNCAI